MTDSYVRRLVCLANSRKTGGRCLAGKAVTGTAAGQWIRPVGPRQAGELHPLEGAYRNAAPIEVGDVFRIQLSGQKPHAYQPENEVITPNYYCSAEGKMTWTQLMGHVDQPSNRIWIDGHSTRYGLNDKLPENLAPSIGESLKLISVNDFQIVIGHEWPDYGNKRTTRGSFTFGHSTYILRVTDPKIEAEFSGCVDGSYAVGEAMLCISLGEPYKEEAYKLIASVIRKGFYGIV